MNLKIFGFRSCGLLLIVSVISFLSPFQVRADVPTQENTIEESAVKEIGPPLEDAKAQSRRTRWYRIGMALSALVIATVAIILASHNKGHHAHEST